MKDDGSLGCDRNPVPSVCTMSILFGWRVHPFMKTKSSGFGQRMTSLLCRCVTWRTTSAPSGDLGGRNSTNWVNSTISQLNYGRAVAFCFVLCDSERCHMDVF